MSTINKVANTVPTTNAKPVANAPAAKAPVAADQLTLSTSPKPVLPKAEPQPLKIFGKQLLLTGTLAGSAAIIGATVWQMGSIPAMVAGALAIGLLGVLGWGLLRQPHAFD
ncbi:MAG: hypothetical protein JWM80_3688 [Cyanobacteria bacterium RYN_339]|nr:hypothetical protein [Cyanobacteria bacterium RYN_339]